MKMKAAYINAFGGPEVIEYGEVDIPEIQEDEILVKNHIIGVGKPDFLVRSGNDPYLENKFPNLVIGNESSGEVVAVGDKIKNIKVGDMVSVLNGTGCGSHAEYSCCKENFAIKLPEGIMPNQVPGILNLQVAYALLFDAARMSAGQSLYIPSAAGGLGTTLIQMAVSKGIYVIASASTKEKCDALLLCGADHVFNYTEADEKKEVLSHTSGNGVDVIFDQFAGEKLQSRFDYLADFGQIVLYNWMKGDPQLPQLDTIVKAAWHSQAIRSFSFHVYDNKPEKRLANAEKCFDMIRRGEVKPYVCKDFPLAEAKAAHEYLDSGKAIGKIIMHV